MASKQILPLAVLVIYIFCVCFTEGILEWAPRCCRKGKQKALFANGNPHVCNKDDLARRGFKIPMNRMICRRAERVCCLRQVQKLSCEHGKYTAFQGGSCMPRRNHTGGDHYLECCDCCHLGLKARIVGTNCSVLKSLHDNINPCASAFYVCCSGATVTRPTVTLPPPITLPIKVPTGCAKNVCHHICRETSSGTPMCYCNNGYSLKSDRKSCVDVNECYQSVCNAKTRCINTAGSYRCVPLGDPSAAPACLSKGYEIANGVCSDIDECSRGTALCGLEQTCRNNKGSYRCLCTRGFKAVGLKCVDKDECLTGEARCSPGTVCKNTAGHYTCSFPDSCPAGKEKSNGGCVDIDECGTRQAKCPRSTRCINTDGSYRCVPCPRGTRPQNDKCVDEDECRSGRKVCPDGTRCINLVGTFRCARIKCAPGKKYIEGRGCVDIDECAEKSATCPGGHTCHNTDGSYRCVRQPCRSGYRYRNGRCTDIDECAEKSATCPGGHTCHNTDGSYRCVRQPCRSGYRYRNGRCTDIDECAEKSATCPGGHTCHNTDGSYRCVRQPCRSGYRYRNGRCTDIDECAERSATCPGGHTCHNTDGSYRCVRQSCRSGYRYRNGRCTDIDECGEKSATCPGGHTCHNTDGSYRCVRQPCRSGYRYQNGRCTDIDECAERRVTCPGGQICENVAGSYRCRCRSGYRYQHGRCTDVNECTERLARCPRGQSCINTAGSYRCLRGCSRGFRYQNGRCVDIDECREGLGTCRRPSVCFNTVGSFRCQYVRQCRSGFQLVNGRCADINECTGVKSVCSASTMCENIAGSYRCKPIPISCPAGYRPQNRRCVLIISTPCTGFRCPRNYRCEVKSGRATCADVNECREKPNACRQGETCINRAGHYICRCPSGYQRSSITRRCEDRDECRLRPCAHNCRNTAGSFTCSCRAGFILANDKQKCLDVDECAKSPNPCQHNCRNTYASYNCFCNAGFRLASDRRSCDDIDECASQTSRNEYERPCGHDCSNTIGSYRCVCPTGYKLSQGRFCHDIDECSKNPSICGTGTVCRNAYGYHRCIPFSCPEIFYVKERDNGCKLIDNCNEIRQCASIKEKSLRFYAFAMRDGEKVKRVLDYSLYARVRRGRTSLAISKDYLLYLMEQGFKVLDVSCILGVGQRTVERRMSVFGLTVAGFVGPVILKFYIHSGNEAGHFSVRRINNNRAEIWTTIPIRGPKEYIMQFFGEVLVGGKLESKYRITLYVFVSRYSF